MENKKIYSQDSYKKLIINNGGKILFCFIIVFYLVPIVRSESVNYLIGVTCIVGMAIFVFIISSIKIKKFIHEIEFNFEMRSVLLSTYRSEEVIEVGFDDLIINKKLGYLVFKYKNRKFIYNGKIGDDLNSCVKRIMNKSRVEGRATLSD